MFTSFTRPRRNSLCYDLATSRCSRGVADHIASTYPAFVFQELCRQIWRLCGILMRRAA